MCIEAALYPWSILNVSFIESDECPIPWEEILLWHNVGSICTGGGFATQYNLTGEELTRPEAKNPLHDI